MASLSSPGVQVTVSDNSQYAANGPTTTPLFILATRANKQNGDGSGIALGTQESNILRSVTSRREVVQTLGLPAFVTANGSPVHGHETNEYGLHALWDFMDTSALAYYIRADVDLGGLLPSDTAPTNKVADGTYWIEKDVVVGGFYRRNAANTGWDAVPASIYTAAPVNGDGAVGDIALDYSTAAGTVKIKTTSTSWVAMSSSLNLSSTSINSRTATTATMWISDAAPTGAGANDYWWKTSKVSGGYDLKIKKYRASDDTWVEVIPTRSLIEPTTKTTSTVWEDLSAFSSNASHPLKVGTGSAFVALTTVLNNVEPTAAADDGDLWYSDDITDFALYVEDSNAWTLITTTTDSDPSDTEKVISASAPSTPSTGAIWVDVSPENLDNFPVLKRWNGTSWEDITASVSLSGYVSPTLVANGSYWINFDDPTTKCTVKEYDSTYEPVVISESTGLPVTFNASTHGRWKPIAGTLFTRKAQRYVVATALRAAVASTPNLESAAYNYQFIVCSAYPELYPDMIALNTAINDRAHILADAPFTMVPSGVTVGREITVTDWMTNARGASETGETGYASSGIPYASMYYPHGISTNADGLKVFVPASTMMIKTLVRSDLNASVINAAIGVSNGLITNGDSVGHLNNTGVYKSILLTPAQSGLLYDNNVNMIENIYRYGLRNMGNRTLYGDTSMLSKVHVARLVSKMKFDMKDSFRPYIGKPNDAQTWLAMRNVATRYMTGLVTARSVSEFLVIVDENNNGPEFSPDADEVFVDIAFIPVGAIEYVTVRLNVESPGNTLGL